MIRIGLVARMDNTGLGWQTKAFYDHMNPHKTMVIDMQSHNGNQQYPDRYPGAMFVRGLPTRGDIDEFLRDLDVVFVAEAPYNYWLYERARELGIKTAVQYNYEFLDWLKYPEMPTPDMLIAPSQWHYDDVQAFCDSRNIEHVYLHCPADRALVPLREIKLARLFLHTGGRPAAYDRNGTKVVIEASKLLKTDAKIKIHLQGNQGLGHQLTDTIQDYLDYIKTHGDESKIILDHTEPPHYKDIYKEGDVWVLPRRYGGNCLPLNEALSTGMPAIMPNIDPNDSFLPEEWLIPATTSRQFEPRTVIDIYDPSAKALAQKIDEFYLMDEREFRNHHQQANEIADDISWETLKPAYQDALEELCK